MGTLEANFEKNNCTTSVGEFNYSSHEKIEGKQPVYLYKHYMVKFFYGWSAILRYIGIFSIYFSNDVAINVFNHRKKSNYSLEIQFLRDIEYYHFS